MTSEFETKNRIEWAKRIHTIFPIIIPHICEFTSREDIARVLGVVSDPNLTYVLFPNHGGFELGKIESVDEFLVLDCNGLPHGISPKRLVFHSFGKQLEWSYFRLEVISWGRLDIVDPEVHEEGTFLILPKSAPYNQVAITDDGRHSNMTDNEFRTFIKDFHDGTLAITDRQ